MSITQARILRKATTPPERKLWAVLRQRPDGLKFRRQHPIGPFVADFYCDSARLVIEIDGNAHDMGDNPLRDARRDAWLSEQNIAVVRYRAADVYRDVEPVVIHILEMARQRTPPSGFACHLPRKTGGGHDCATPAAPIAIRA